jgi:hypothetical protein
MKRLHGRRIRSHRSYTVKELSKLLVLAENTVRRWIKDSLPTVQVRRPTLILGRDLKQFLDRKRSARKRRCPSGYLFCVRCREPKIPAGSMVDWLPSVSGTGLLQGICPSCGSLIHRAASTANAARFEVVTEGLDVTLPRAQRRLCEPASALVNVHFGGALHAKS